MIKIRGQKRLALFQMGGSTPVYDNLNAETGPKFLPKDYYRYTTPEINTSVDYNNNYTGKRLELPNQYGIDKPSINSDITEPQDKFRMNGQALNDIIPFGSNIANAFKRLPYPVKPDFEQNVNSQLVDYSADKASLNKDLIGANRGVDRATANPGMANALKVANLGKYFDAKSKLSQGERNTNAGIINRTKEFNSTINARNVERSNEFRQGIQARSIAQQRMQSENLADAANKAQLSRKDKDMQNMENRKLGVLLEMYKDTGVVNRNLLDEIDQEKYKRKPLFFRGK